uniref:DUF4773 domain-containing protein n=1 Tax=Strigamia maritima TaxID=126957 RepID=T1II91_STRMM
MSVINVGQSDASLECLVYEYWILQKDLITRLQNGCPRMYQICYLEIKFLFFAAQIPEPSPNASPNAKSFFDSKLLPVCSCVVLCINMNLNVEKVEITVVVRLNDKEFYKKSLNALSLLPPICIKLSVPGLNLLGDINIRFQDFKYEEGNLEVCTLAQPRLATRILKTYDLGCYNIEYNASALLSGINSIEMNMFQQTNKANRSPICRRLFAIMIRFSVQTVKWKCSFLLCNHDALKNDNEYNDDDVEDEDKPTTEQVIPVVTPNRCKCYVLNCFCCNHLLSKEIELNHRVCFNITYLNEEVGVRVQMLIGSKVVLTKRVSVKNPPPICAGDPIIKITATVCIEFHHLDWPHGTFKKFQGCMAFTALLLLKEVCRYEFGCYSVDMDVNTVATPTLPPDDTVPENLN